MKNLDFKKVDIRKLVGTVVGGVFFLFCILFFTYAYYNWRSENADVVLGIDDLSTMCVMGSNVNVTDIGPVLDYRDGVKAEFSIENNQGTAGTISLNLAITSVSEELLIEAFKYVVVADSLGGTNYDYDNPILTGNFSTFNIGNNIVTDSLTIPANSTYSYQFIIYLDGSVYNDINIQQNNLTATLELGDCGMSIEQPDTVAPVASISTTNTLKSDSQTATLNCSDDIGVVSYYWGTTAPTETSTYTEITSVANMSIDKTISATGTYYLACKDEVGNVSTAVNQIYYSYTVNNMLLTTTGTSGTYTTANYTQMSTNTYLAPSGLRLTLASIYTIPTGASSSSFKGVSVGTASTTAATVSMEDPGLSANSAYTMWFDRPIVKITYHSNNLLYNLNDIGTLTDANIDYSISDGVVTVTASRDGGYGFTEARVYLEAGKTYYFNCDTDGTWSADDVESGSTVEAFLMKDKTYSDTVPFIHLGSNDNYAFTPTVSGTYWLRLDVNAAGETHTFSNITISTVVDEQNSGSGDVLGTLPTPSYTGYQFDGWYTEEVGGEQINSNSTVPTTDTTYYAHWTVKGVLIRLNTNGGSKGSSSNSGYGVDSNGYVTMGGLLDVAFIAYGASTDHSGIWNYNNTQYVNITKSGYTAQSGAEWICLSGCTTANKTYNQDTVYSSSDFCDASNGNCTVVLGVNWVKDEYLTISSYSTHGSYNACSSNYTVQYTFNISVSSGSVASGKLCYHSGTAVSTACANYNNSGSTGYGCAMFNSNTTWNFYRSNACAYAEATGTNGKSASKAQCD